MKLTSLDLFSCIGCQALGFKRAGIRTTQMCEIVPWRIRQLRRNFPGVPIHEDIKTFRPEPADITVAVRRVRARAELLSFMDTETHPLSGCRCSDAGSKPDQNGLSWSSLPPSRDGRSRSSRIYFASASTSRSLSSALMIWVRRIRDADASLLPAPLVRDWKSPGGRSHDRLKSSKGLPLPEVIGTRIPSSLSVWILGVQKSLVLDNDE